MRLSGCVRLDLHPLTGTWFHAIRVQHWKTRLKTDHSKTTTSRFSAGKVAVLCHALLYLAEGFEIALREVGALLGLPHAPISNPEGAWTTFGLDVVLQSVADLAIPAQLKRIGSNLQEMTGDWVFHRPGPAPTQRLGAALFAVDGIEAFLTPSAKSPTHRNLMIFPEKLRAGSRITFRNPATGKIESLFP